MNDDNLYPDDENGQILSNIAESGTDLSGEFEVEFAHLAPDGKSANKIVQEVIALGYKVEIYEPDEESIEEGDTTWDVICISNIVPSHSNITRIEAQLADIARRHGGREDGWGFME